MLFREPFSAGSIVLLSAVTVSEVRIAPFWYAKRTVTGASRRPATRNVPVGRTAATVRAALALAPVVRAEVRPLEATATGTTPMTAAADITSRDVRVGIHEIRPSAEDFQPETTANRESDLAHARALTPL